MRKLAIISEVGIYCSDIITTLFNHFADGPWFPPNVFFSRIIFRVPSQSIGALIVSK